MQSEDQYLERTVDMVTKIRAMREAAEKEMNRFTRIADYEVRHGIGQKPKGEVVPDRTAPRPSPVRGRSKKAAKRPGMPQASIAFEPVPGERREGGEDA
jgi:hypothetical protein